MRHVNVPLEPVTVANAKPRDKAYALTDGAWKMTEREIYSDLSGDYSHHMAVSPSTSAKDQGVDPQKASGGLKPTVQSAKVSALRPPT
jgi:hypothetical protein